MEDSYPERLRAALTAAGISRRKLAPLYAAETGNKPDSEYRAIGKYLAGEEVPEPERAAILAVLLRSPGLALVGAVPSRRRGRQAELEARVERLETALGALGPDLEALETLPERVLALEQQVQPKKNRARR